MNGILFAKKLQKCLITEKDKKQITKLNKLTIVNSIAREDLRFKTQILEKTTNDKEF